MGGRIAGVPLHSEMIRRGLTGIPRHVIINHLATNAVAFSPGWKTRALFKRKLSDQQVRPNHGYTDAIRIEGKMLAKFIVSSFQTLVEIALWAFLLICFFAGGGLVSGLGGSFTVGAILGLSFWFVFSILVFGSALLLSDIRRSIRAIEAANGAAGLPLSDIRKSVLAIEARTSARTGA